MPSMNDVEARTKAYADARVHLAQIVSELHEGLEAIKRSNLPRIRRAIARASEAESQLKAILADVPDLFVKPKTVVLHGIKVGFEKGKGSIQFEDEDKVVQLIEKRLPDLVDQLVKTTKRPLKTGLAQLTVQQLKAIGCTVEEAGDQVVVRAVDKDVDKLVAALLKGAADDEN